MARLDEAELAVFPSDWGHVISEPRGFSRAAEFAAMASEAKKQIAAATDASMPLEPYQLISQYTLEPLLRSVAEKLPSVTVRYGTEFLDFTETAPFKNNGTGAR